MGLTAPSAQTAQHWTQTAQTPQTLTETIQTQTQMAHSWAQTAPTAQTTQTEQKMMSSTADLLLLTSSLFWLFA